MCSTRRMPLRGGEEEEGGGEEPVAVKEMARERVDKSETNVRETRLEQLEQTHGKSTSQWLQATNNDR